MKRRYYLINEGGSYLTTIYPGSISKTNNLDDALFINETASLDFLRDLIKVVEERDRDTSSWKAMAQTVSFEEVDLQ